MSKKTMKLPLCLIKIDGQTQQRNIDNETLAHYTAMMKELGNVFPPIEVVFDGKHYWLWDGFHRYFAAKDAGFPGISAAITQGTQRDAIWLSFSANRDHGLKRDAQSTREIIEKILHDEEWKKLTQEEIARHVGISQQRVSMLIKDIKDYKIPVSQPPCENGRKKSDTSKSDEKDRKEPIPDKKLTGNSTNSRTPQFGKAFVSDAVGNNVPQHLQGVFLRQQEIKDYINRLNEIKRQVKEAAAADPDLWFYFRMNPCEIEIDNVKRQFRFAVPHAVCPYCGGEDSKSCQACKGAGFINEEMYQNTPEEMKK